MKSDILRFRRLLAGLGIGLGAAAIALLAGVLPFVLSFLETVELKTYDRRMRLTADPASARRDIALVEINETSLRALEPVAGRWPWPRAVHASVINFLARAPARVIVYDVLFIERDSRVGFDFGDSKWSGAESDAAFVKSVAGAGNVILLADAVYEGVEAGALPPGSAREWRDAGYRLGPDVEERPVVTPPFDDLARAGLGLGHNLAVFDEDGPLRRVVPFIRSGDRVLPSLGVAAALAAGRIPPGAIAQDAEAIRLGDRRMPVIVHDVPAFEGHESSRHSLRALINYRGPALLDDGRSRPYAAYSFFDLLYSEEQILAGEKPDIDPAAFRDKIVFVGVSATGLADVFTTPFGETGRMSGIQMHAGVADDILSNRFMRPAGAASRVVAVVAVALVVGVTAAFVSVPWTVAVAIVTAAAFGFLSIRLFAAGVFLDVSQPALALSLSLFGGVAYQYFVEGREKRRVKALFGRYVPRDVFHQLMTDPGLARLGGTRREMTVLFSDIRGFTTASESGTPEGIVTMLNEYFSRMVEVIFANHGTVDKFVGDMVMALFGAPLDDPRHADHAVSAALAMSDALGELNRKWVAEGRPSMDIGVGINSGEMIAGNIGSEAIMSYTVIGDAVNLGARLESLNKDYGTRIIISDATRSRLTGAYALRPLGEVVVKGKTQPVRIWEVTGRNGHETDTERTRNEHGNEP
jgi:adenylate cyclase